MQNAATLLGWVDGWGAEDDSSENMEESETRGSKAYLEAAEEALGRRLEAICHPFWFQ